MSEKNNTASLGWGTRIAYGLSLIHILPADEIDPPAPLTVSHSGAQAATQNTNKKHTEISVNKERMLLQMCIRDRCLEIVEILSGREYIARIIRNQRVFPQTGHMPVSYTHLHPSSRTG